MENTITIGEQSWRIKANAITPFHYKSQFKQDLLKDTFQALGGVGSLMELREVEEGRSVEQLNAVIEKIDTTLIYQLLWVFIKTAQPSTVPSFYEWLNDLDYVPVTDLLLNEKFLELLTGNIHRKK